MCIRDSDGTVYNVATDEEIAIIDLVKTIAIKMGINDVDIRFEGYRKSDPERRLLNTDKSLSLIHILKNVK